MENLQGRKYPIFIGIVVIVLCVWLASGSHDGYRGENNNNLNIITVTGHGEVQAAPDIANISFTIKKEDKSVKDAQAQVAEVEAKALNSLKTNGILDADRKAESVSFNPKYEYQFNLNGKMVSCALSDMYPCPGSNVVVGYEAYETITVKVGNVDSVGKIVQDLGTLGVTELSGPNFTVDKEDAFKNTARKEAIDEAKAKAKELAKELDVRLGNMTSFNESGNYPTPMYVNAKMDSVSGTGAPTPAILPVGENTISSDVTITYEIR